MNGGRGAFDVEEHKNRRRKQITDGIKEGKEPRFVSGQGHSIKLPWWPGFSRSKNFHGCCPGGCKQLKLTEA